MSGSYEVRAGPPHRPAEAFELDEPVAHPAGIGCTAGKVFGNEVFDDFFSELFSLVEDDERDIELLRYFFYQGYDYVGMPVEENQRYPDGNRTGLF